MPSSQDVKSALGYLSDARMAIVGANTLSSLSSSEVFDPSDIKQTALEAIKCAHPTSKSKLIGAALVQISKSPKDGSEALVELVANLNQLDEKDQRTILDTTEAVYKRAFPEGVKGLQKSRMVNGLVSGIESSHDYGKIDTTMQCLGLVVSGKLHQKVCYTDGTGYVPLAQLRNVTMSSCRETRWDDKDFLEGVHKVTTDPRMKQVVRGWMNNAGILGGANQLDGAPNRNQPRRRKNY